MYESSSYGPWRIVLPITLKILGLFMRFSGSSDSQVRSLFPALGSPAVGDPGFHLRCGFSSCNRSGSQARSDLVRPEDGLQCTKYRRSPRDYSIAAQIVALTRPVTLIDIRQRTPDPRTHRPQIPIRASHHPRPKIHAPADHDQIITPATSFRSKYLHMFII